MKTAYILILLVLLAIAALYVWNTVSQTKRIEIVRNDDVRLYPVVEYPIDEYPYYYGWWWPWYGGSYNIVGSRYGYYGGLPGFGGHDGHRPGPRPGPGGGGHGGPGPMPGPGPAPGGGGGGHGGPGPGPAPGGGAGATGGGGHGGGGGGGH
jgi:hypothetical protein